MNEKVNGSQREAGKFITASVMICAAEEHSINQRDLQRKTMEN